MITFKTISIFPQIITEYTKYGVINQGIKNNLIKVETFNPRDFSTDKHKRTDLKMYGNEHGQVMECDSFFKCLNYLLLGKNENLPQKIDHNYLQKIQKSKVQKKIVVINLSPSGKTFSHYQSKQLAPKYEQIILICGRYEGLDQRIIDTFVDQEISLGKYILAGGELPALTVMESVSRQIPGVIKNQDSVAEESFSKKLHGKKEYPIYTRPSDYRGLTVPEILLSGDHGVIERWKMENLR